MRFRKRSSRTPRSREETSSRDGGSAITVQVVEDTHAYRADDGSEWWSGGYCPVHEELDGEHRFIAPGERLPDPRVLYCKVAGVRHYPTALQDPSIKVGSAAVLRPEPENPHDANAVGVWDETGTVQLGHIPADLSSTVAGRIRAGEELVAVIVREIRRDSESGPRSAIHLLVAPASELNLSIVDD
jgi:HIRAN domain